MYISNSKSESESYSSSEFHKKSDMKKSAPYHSHATPATTKTTANEKKQKKKMRAISMRRVLCGPHVKKHEIDTGLINHSQTHFLRSCDSFGEWDAFFGSRQTLSREKNKPIARKASIGECKEITE